MIACVPGGPFFSGSVEACVYGKAGVPGAFFLIQVYDRLVPGGPFFSGSVEACVYGKAGVPGVLWLIQVYDRRCSCWPILFRIS